MLRKHLSLAAATLVVIGFVLFKVAHATAIAVDATSGASGGRKMVTVSAIDVTPSTAAITYSEAERNGSFRFYYTTTAFANAADTTRATVTKTNVTTRGSGTLTLSNLKTGTKYYYRFQGYYPKGTANYWATGTLATLGNTSVKRPATSALEAKSGTHDLLGRPHRGATGVVAGDGHADLQLRR